MCRPRSAIQLPDTNLDGTLPASLSGLTALTTLVLNANAGLAGPITALSTLTQLNYIDVSVSTLGGSIDVLTQLISLTSAALNRANFSGTFCPVRFAR